MAIKLSNGQYKCVFCEFTNPNPSIVDDHRDKAHDVVYVPILRTDLQRLMQFILTGDRELLTETLYKTLKTYSKFRIRG